MKKAAFQWNTATNSETARVHEGWLEIQNEAIAAGGAWTWLANEAHRVPLELARRIVNHFAWLRADGSLKRYHPGKLARAALTEPAFEFHECTACALEACAEAIERARAPAFRAFTREPDPADISIVLLAAEVQLQPPPKTEQAAAAARARAEIRARGRK